MSSAWQSKAERPNFQADSSPANTKLVIGHLDTGEPIYFDGTIGRKEAGATDPPANGNGRSKSPFVRKVPRENPNLAAALELLNLGFWPVAIRARGEKLSGSDEKTRIAEGKEPMGKSWGLQSWDDEKLHGCLIANPRRGVGICFGPERGPGGSWLADLEGDSPEAVQSLAIVLGSDQPPQTPSWGSVRGGHAMFSVDGERLLTLLARAGAKEGTGIKAGVWHLEQLPGLEWRIGGYKADGVVKQVQSVVPPSLGTDGTPRTWKVGPTTPVMELSESAYQVLEGLAEIAEERAAIQDVEREQECDHAVHSDSNSHVNGEATKSPFACKVNDVDPMIRYVARAVEKEIATLAATPEGNRNAQLNISAFKLGTLVGARVLSRADVEQSLAAIAHSIGLGDYETTKTIQSGLGDGERLPRDLSHVGRDRKTSSGGKASDGQGGDKGKGKPEGKPLDLSWVANDYATLADVDRVLDDTGYAWNLWITRGSLTAVVADPGCGKTRLVSDWCRRMWFGEPMPDGTPSPFPAGTKSLWLCYDRNWRGMVRTFKQFGVPIDQAVILPTRKGKPLFLPDFDSPETMLILREFIRVHTPGLLVIDTTTYASIYNTGKPNESKIAYDPIMDVLMETNQAGLGLTHTNKEGGVLNRRFLERCRVQIGITRPDPNSPKRIRVEVKKSDDNIPPAMGAEFNGTSVIYDHTPPAEPGPAPRGRPAKAAPGMADFLWEFLQLSPAPIVSIVDAARDKGLLKQPTAETPKPSISSLYDAKRWIERLHPGKYVHEFEMVTPKGKTLKHWEIADKPEDEEDAEDREPF